MNEEKNSFLYKLLRLPFVYKSYQALITKSNTYEVIYKNIFQSNEGSVVLDCGCGPAQYRKYIECKKYYGIDFNEKHIKKAIKANPGDSFINGNVVNYDFSELPEFTDVLIFGLLHHLNDKNASRLIEKLSSQIKEGGKLVAIDPLYVEENKSTYNKISNFIASKDQGNFVRNEFEYIELVNTKNTKIKQKKFKNLLRIPFHHNVLYIYRI
tara:strand:+ start:844 stop:1476 length:633 start_codon:yes stop_codon:yes gene_type:complete